jgi:3-deoxy-D-manno-octulosonate 8-phosphate phosphatase (KDO 8-P phosphatase)
MSSELNQKLADIQLIITDVDGVLTDGAIYIGHDDVELKKFCVADGSAVALLRTAGIKLAFISGRYSKATERRAKELKVSDVFNGTINKLTPYESLKSKYNLTDDQIVYIGDDLIDIPVMKKVGVPIAVENAYPPVKRVAVYTTKASGGNGALREAVEWILKQQNRLTTVFEKLELEIHSTGK